MAGRGLAELPGCWEITLCLGNPVWRGDAEKQGFSGEYLCQFKKDCFVLFYFKETLGGKW